MPKRARIFRPISAEADRRAPQRDYDERRGPDRQFYGTTRWRKVRAIKLAKDPLCEECEKHGQTTPANEVDHIIPREDRPDLTFVMSNLQSLCKTCHSKKTRHEQHSRRAGQTSSP